MNDVRVVIVSPYSPRWSNIASIRWENFARYLSTQFETYLLTSYFNEEFTERNFDLGKAKLIEIPLKMYLRNPYQNKNEISSKNKEDGSGLYLFKSIYKYLKPELRFLLEKFLPVSAGGILFHDYDKYIFQIEKILEECRKVILITTYDPWFSLRIGRWVKENFPEKAIWFADFRDPCFNVHESRISYLRVFRKLTFDLLNLVDAIFVVSRSMKDNFEPLFGGKVFFLPNGFDDSREIFDARFNESEITLQKSLSEKKFRIVYTGSLYPRTREIDPILNSLNKLKGSLRQKISFVYAGLDYEEIRYKFSKCGMSEILVDLGFVSRNEALQIQKNADLLLLIVYTGEKDEEGRSIRTGKVYEYLSSAKPILAIAPESWEMRSEIECDGVSKVFRKDRIDEIANFIESLIESPALKLNFNERSKVLNKYRYENLSKELLEIILNFLGEKTLGSVE